MKLAPLTMQRVFISVALLFLFSFYVNAQDPVKADTADSSAVNNDSVPLKKHGTKYHVNHYGLYNFTSAYQSSAFNSRFRPGANNRLDADVDFYGNSSDVPSGLVFRMLFNRPVPDRLKDRTDKAINKEIRFEESLKSGFTYRRYLKKVDWTLMLGYYYRQMMNMNAPKQAFEAAFYGNSRFEGDTINLSNINFQYYNYNQLSIGLYKTFDYGKYQMEIGFAGSFLQLIQNLDVETGKNTWIYTAPYGEYITANYNLTFNQASDGQPAFTKMPGLGASGDFHLAFKNKDKWRFSIDLSDLGIITVRKAPVNYSGSGHDSIVGIYIPNLLEFSSQTFDTLKLDSVVKSKLPVKTANSYSMFLPFTLQAVFSKPLLNDRLVLSFGILYRHIPNYKAYGFIKANYFMKRNMVVSLSAGAGGYARFNVGFEFSKAWKYFDLAIGSANLPGLIASAYVPGSSLYLRLGATF